jgi:site-specific DNA-methyltransferase (adenine-specific)
MRYLQRLVTPKGGICLDPFAGSGTSGCSASFEDIGEIILMEMDETYIPIIEARTKYWSIERNRINYLDKIKKQKQEVVENQFKLAL